jgi:hypothetical protein
MSLSFTLPVVGSISLLMQRIKVDLPAPEEPMIITTCGCNISRLISSSAVKPPGYVFERPLMMNIIYLAMAGIKIIFGRK